MSTPSLPVPVNRLRPLLASGRLAVGTMLVECKDPAVLTILAHGGCDFVLLDNEHGQFSIESVAHLSRAARLAGITPIVRIPELTYAQVAQSLDGGAQGIMLPRVTTRAEVEECVASMKYAPEGRRGSVLARGHTDFLTGPLEETLRALNRESFLIVQIETRQAVERLDELLSVPGVDAALVGPTDLSIALGVPGQLDSAELQDAVEQTMTACRRHDVVPAIHTNEVARTAYWAGRGMRMVSISSELGLLLGGVRGAVAEIRRTG